MQIAESMRAAGRARRSIVVESAAPTSQIAFGAASVLRLEVSMVRRNSSGLVTALGWSGGMVSHEEAAANIHLDRVHYYVARPDGTHASVIVSYGPRGASLRAHWDETGHNNLLDLPEF